MALLAVPGSALAAQRFAAPGAGGTCAAGDPCSLAIAVNLAGPADEVIVAPGDYNLGSTALVVPATVAVHGADGQPRPNISGATDIAGGPLVRTTGGSLRHLSIRQDGPGGVLGTSIAVDATTATLTDVAVADTQSGAIAVQLGTLTTMATSTVVAAAPNSQAVSSGGAGNSLHNVSAYSTSAAIGAEVPVTATNSIALGGTTGPVTMLPANPSGPLLANPSGGDFHQLPGSPTIDAGLVDPAAGLADPDGDARILGATQDIGADEYVSHRPMASTGDASGTTVTGSVNPNGIATSYRFDFGATPLYGSSTPAGDAGSGASAGPVSTQLSGLAPGSIVHYRVVATNADGETAGLDRILVTPGTLTTTTQLSAPHFTALSAPTTTTVGEPITIEATGSDRNDPINSITIDFDDGPGFFAESACRLRPRNRAFRDNRRSSFSVPYTFTSPGVHTVEVTLGSGDCRRRGQRTRQTIQVNVVPKAKQRLARVRVREERIVLAADCANADVLPTPGNTRKIETSTLCLLNQVRAQYKLGKFRRNKKLRRAAALHNGYMMRAQNMAHQVAGEPPLGARFRKVRYRGGGGENLGVGAGVPYATPRSMVVAWMGSPVHRANILERAYHTIGIAVLASKPLPPPVPGATYTTEFGTTRR